MKSPKSHPLIRFLAALKPSRVSFIKYARLIGWLVVVSIVGAYAESYIGSVFLRVVINLSIIYLTLVIVFDTAALAINFLYRKKNGRSDQHADSFTLGIKRLSSALVVFIFVLFVIDVFVPLKTFIGSLTIAMALIGLALRDFITNFVNGLNIMFSSPFQLGEYIKVGDLKGKIKDMTFTHVHLQTEAQNMVFVPNNVMLSKEIVNFSKNKVKKVLVRVVVEKMYYPQYEELQSYIPKRVAEQFPDSVAIADDIVIRVDSIEKDSIVWLVEYQVSRYSFELETALRDYTAELVVAFSSKTSVV
jgi:small-conductance mechanosensitive channel